MDEIADLIDRVLTTTEPGTTSKGAPSKAQHVLDPKIADEISRRATDLRGRLPALPGDRPGLTALDDPPRPQPVQVDQLLTWFLPRRSGSRPGRRAAYQQRAADPGQRTRTTSTATAHPRRPARGPVTRPLARRPLLRPRPSSPCPAQLRRRRSARPGASGCRRPPRPAPDPYRTQACRPPARNSWSCARYAMSPPGAASVSGQPPTPVSPQITVSRTGGYGPRASPPGPAPYPT